MEKCGTREQTSPHKQTIKRESEKLTGK